MIAFTIITPAWDPLGSCAGARSLSWSSGRVVVMAMTLPRARADFFSPSTTASRRPGPKVPRGVRASRRLGIPGSDRLIDQVFLMPVTMVSAIAGWLRRGRVRVRAAGSRVLRWPGRGTL